MRPSIWEVIRPALADRKGWATFIGTPKGHNSFYDIYAGKPGTEWEKVDAYRLLLKASDTSALDDEELALMRNSLAPEAYAQELECSFEAAIQGAIYGRSLASAIEKGQVAPVPYDPSALVVTAWDLGIGDPTAIVFAQQVGRKICVIDFYESSGVDLAHYATVVRERGYKYSGHILPHDAATRELTSGKSREEVLRGLGLDHVTVLEQHRVEDGINAARLLLARSWFDKDKCFQLLECLKLYRYEFDEKRKTFKNNPCHDWTSHAADAFRYLAMGIGQVTPNMAFNRPIVYPNMGIV